MSVRIGQLAIAAMVALWAITPAGVRAAPASRPAAVDPHVAQFAAAIDSWDLKTPQADLEQQAPALLADLSKLDADKIIAVGAWREFARYFGQIEKPSAAQKETLKWLTQQPRLLPVLMSAVSEQDDPELVLRLLADLAKAQPAAIDAMPDLTTAFAVVWSKGRDGPESDLPDPAHVARLYNYYVNARGTLRFDLSDLPWQLSIYAIDNRASEADVAWAADRYKTRQHIGGVYFDVRYDDAAYYQGAEKQIDRRAYTLPNLLQFGGVCTDQAYYATQVARSLGVPAVVCLGESGAGRGDHAWAGYLDVAGRRAFWNFSEGRYKEDLFWSGTVTDPQTFQTISDADVSLLAELQNSAPPQRLVSGLLVKLADVLDEKTRADVYAKAIDLCPGNRMAWAALADLGANKKLSQDQVNLAAKAVEKFALRDYPEFACLMMLRLCSGAALDDHVTAMDRIADEFAQRPDLVAMVRLQQGDLLLLNDRLDAALVAFGDVLSRRNSAGPAVLRALGRIDLILRARKDLNRLATVYASVWSQMVPPDMSAYAASTPYFRIGVAYANLLDQIGSHSAAATVRSRLATLVSK